MSSFEGNNLNMQIHIFKIITYNILFFTSIHFPVLFELDVLVLLKYCNNQVVVAKIWIGWSRKFMGHLDIKIIWTVVPISITEPRTSGQTSETSNIFAPNIFQNVGASRQIIHVESWLSYTKGERNIFLKVFHANIFSLDRHSTLMIFVWDYLNDQRLQLTRQTSNYWTMSCFN